VLTARLRPQQQQAIVQLRAVHLENMRTLAARRKARIAELEVCFPRETV